MTGRIAAHTKVGGTGGEAVTAGKVVGGAILTAKACCCLIAFSFVKEGIRGIGPICFKLPTRERAR